MLKNRYIFGVEVDPNALDSFRFKLEDLLYIDTWQPKKNYQVPRFVTRDKIFSLSLTLSACAAGFPNFDLFLNGTLLNLERVERFEQTPFGADIHFKETDFKLTMSRYKWEGANWPELLKANADFPIDNRLIIGSKVLDKGLSIPCFIEAKDVFYIDIWKPKKNYEVPRFYTKEGMFVEILTLHACQHAFPYFISLDKSNLVNLDTVDHAIDTTFQVTVVFKESNYTTIMAGAKKRLFSYLIK